MKLRGEWHRLECHMFMFVITQMGEWSSIGAVW